MDDTLVAPRFATTICAENEGVGTARSNRIRLEEEIEWNAILSLV
jgi:hypothetical protein